MPNKLSNAIKAANKKSFLNTTALLTGSAATLVLMGLMPQANAEEAAQPEEVIITGIRGSLKAAIDVKRESAAVVDAISAEDIGKFPDKNVAESLQRVPGVTINRGFTGEGNEVSIRGTNPELTSVLLNGQYVASTGWFSQTNARRSFNMDLMPSEMVKKVEVYKSPVASLDEGGVGGTVVVETRKPLELNANTVYASVEGQTNSLASGDTGGGATGMYSWKNSEETFGVLGAVSTLKTIGRANKAENYWEEGWAGSGVSEFNQDRTRDAYDLTAQLAPTDKLTFTGHFFETHLNDGNTNQNFLVVQSSSTGSSTINPIFKSGTAGGRLTPNGTATKGELTDHFDVFDDTNSREADIKSDTYTLGADFKGDTFTLSGVLGKTKADGGDGGNIETTWGIQNITQATNPGITADIDMDGKTSMQYKLNGLDSSKADWQAALPGFLGRTAHNVHDDETYGQIDAKFDVALGTINKIEAGVKVRSHDFNTHTINYAYTGTVLNNTATTLSDFQDGVIHHSGEGLFGDSLTDIARVNVGKVRAEYKGHEAAGVEQKAAFGELQEDIQAYYTQADYEGQGFSGNFGVRVVKTDVTGTRYTANAISGVDNSKENIDGSYFDILPTFNLKLDLTDDVIARFSAGKVMSRPGYTTMNPALNFTYSTKQASSGDPTIDPYRATQIDMGLEWYFAEGAIASASIFTKDVGSFLSSKTYTTPITDVHGTYDYSITVPALGQGGKLQGIELQYQQNFGNFGTIANYTYVDSYGKDGGGNKIALPGTSRNSYNLTGYYENDLFAVRIAYTHRSEFLAEGLGIGGSDIFAPQQFVDATATWHATENIDLSFDVQNALGEVTTSSHNPAGSTGPLDTLRLSNDNGTRYYLKASFKM